MECEFDELLYPWYVAGVITPIFSLVWFCLLLVYWRIWREAAKHAKQLRAHNSQESSSDWKSVQVSSAAHPATEPQLAKLKLAL